MKRTSMTICVICALLLTSLTNAYAQSAPKKTSSNASDEFVFNVERMFNEGMLVQMPDGYSISISDGKLNAYIPLFCSEEYHLLDSSVSYGLVFKDEPISVTTKDRKGVHTVYFSVHDGIQKYRISLSYSDPDSADLFVRGQNIYAEFQGTVTALK